MSKINALEAKPAEALVRAAASDRLEPLRPIGVVGADTTRRPNDREVLTFGITVVERSIDDFSNDGRLRGSAFLSRARDLALLSVGDIDLRSPHTSTVYITRSGFSWQTFTMVIDPKHIIRIEYCQP